METAVAVMNAPKASKMTGELRMHELCIKNWIYM